MAASKEDSESLEGVAGRTLSESIGKIADGIKEEIKNTRFDGETGLEYEQEQLSVVGRFKQSADSLLPHQYKHHLVVLKKKDRNINPSDILGDKDKPHKKVLIFSRAGIGKSAMFQWLSKEWALGRWGTQFTLLFLLQLGSIMSSGISVNCIELLAFYGLYQLQEDTDMAGPSSWIQNSVHNVIIFLDGLNEIPGFKKRLMDAPKITDPLQKASPLDICMNLINGNLLRRSTVVMASRPFDGLNEIRKDSKAELVGLTSKKIAEYVKGRYPSQADQILSALHQNPILLSACSITFYCMLITRLMSEGVKFINEEVKTYTGLMSFLLIQLATRKNPASDVVFNVSEYFPKFAKLAYQGIFPSAGSKDLPKFVFDEEDLVQVDLHSKDLQSLQESGILQIERKKIGQEESITAKFVHLNVQELLAVSHFLTIGPQSESSVDEMFSSGKLDMCFLYMFGLQFDKTNPWIRKICSAVSPSGSSPTPGTESQLASNLDTLSTKGDVGKLKMCQLLYEGQWVEGAEQMAHYLVTEGKLSVANIAARSVMTAVDVLAVDFVSRYAEPLSCLKLSDVKADDSFLKVMLSTLYERNLKFLRELDLNGNSIKDEGAKRLAATLATNTSLTELNIANNDIGPSGAEALAELLAQNTSLAKLNLWCNYIGTDGARALAKPLVSNNSLTNLNVSNNKIGVTGAEDIAQMLLSNKMLTELDISFNYEVGPAGAQAFADVLAVNTSLTVLYLTYDEIGPIGAKSIAEMLTRNNSLKELSISYNKIGDIGAQAVAEALDHNTSLTVLDIKFNEIGEAGVKAITKAVGHNASLLDLDISVNPTSGMCDMAIAEMVATNSSLTALNIAYNEIGQIGGKAVTEALAGNTSLTKLDMSYNYLGDAAIEALADSLVINTSLKELDITYNNTTDIGNKAIAQIKATNTSLTELRGYQIL